ncbi:hypothetical protein IKG73_02125 [Candidatus Saccharibacteria bacterium]|nr:hypothetical protein [Candidatus Saccharibacteria bacterium]
MTIRREPEIESVLEKVSRNALSKIPKNNDELWEALIESFKMARRGKLATADEFKFEARWMENLEILFEDIISGRYRPSRSKAFVTHVPVDREIFAAPFRDRIVHHLIYGVCGLWWDRRFICNSFSCRDNKGTKVGAEALQHCMRAAIEADKRDGLSGKGVRVLKGDLTGYFMSLRRNILFEKVSWGLREQFSDRGYTYKLMAYLWKEVIFDDPIEGVRRVGKKSDWDDLPSSKSLFCQPPGQGIVIGNLTSQLLSNIMLDALDRHAVYDLKIKYYGRYVDDFFVVAREREYKRLKYVMREEIPGFVKEYGLTVHPKKQYDQKAIRGVPFLGKKVYATHMTLGRRVVAHYFQAAREVAEGRRDDVSITAFMGIGKHVSSERLNQRVFESVGWEYKF